MVKAFRPSLEPPADRHVRVNNYARPGLCVIICAGVASLVLSAFAASGWNIYSNRFDYNRFHFSSGDEVAVSDITSDFSSMFCDSYEVKLWAKGQVYFLPSTAEVNKSLIGPEETISMLQVPGLAYTEFRLYLLDQSELRLSACRQNGSRELPADIVLIKGKSNLKTWRENKACTGCVDQRVKIPLDAMCDDEEELQQAGPLQETDELFRSEDGSLSGKSDSSSSEVEILDRIQTQSPQKRSVTSNKTKELTVLRSDISNLGATVEQESNEENGDELKFDSDLFVQRGHPATFNHTVSSNDRYYLIIFYGTPGGPESLFTDPGVRLQGTVRRTGFDVRQAKQVCDVTGGDPTSFLDILESETQTTGLSNSTSLNTCQFDLPWGSDMDIVVRFGDFHLNDVRKDEVDGGLGDMYGDGMDPGVDTTINGVLSFPNREHDGMETKCHARLSMWVCLFGVLPVVLVFLFSVLIGFLLCRRQQPTLARVTATVTARWRKKQHHHHHHHKGKKKKSHPTKDGDGLVDGEVLPEGAQSSMAIQGD